ncbi:hypothetical protein EPUL_004202, partial [Erysiphe pulchra]
PISPSPFIPPAPPLNLEPPAKTADGRQILKPVAPSKCSIPESPQYNSRNKSDIANAFLPRELAEIIATRQRGEPNFAAANSSPSLLRAPLLSKLNKGNENGNNKGKDKDKNLTKTKVAIPRIASNQGPILGMIKEIELPGITKNNATVALKEQKKARVIHSSNIQTRRLLTSSLSSLIGNIKPVHSGFALSPCTTEAHETILKAISILFLSGVKFEPATNWVSILIPTVPSTIRMEQGQLEVEKSMLADEIERVCSVRPAHLKLYGRNNTDAPYRKWMAYFTKAPRSGFRAFDDSGMVRPSKKQQPISFSPHDPCAVQPLLDWKPTPKTVVIGEFNSVYWAWQPSMNSYYCQKKEIDKWTETHNLTCLIVGEPTRCAGNTPDIAWTSVQNTMAWIRKEDCMNSDYLPIRGFVPNFKASTAISQTSVCKLRISRDKIPQFTKIAMATLNTIEMTEKYAQEICLALDNALKAVGKRPNKKSGKNAPW